MNKRNKSFIIPVLCVGFLIWFLATLAFRVVGQFFFLTESPLIFAVLYLGVLPLLGLISAFTFKKFKLSGLENVVGGVLLVLPGMIIDTFVIHFFEYILPNIPLNKAASFGSWLMWAYTIVLLTSIIIGLKTEKSSKD